MCEALTGSVVQGLTRKHQIPMGTSHTVYDHDNDEAMGNFIGTKHNFIQTNTHFQFNQQVKPYLDSN